MSNPAPKIELRIRTAVESCSLRAAGMWLKMRYLIEEEPDSQGRLRCGGRPSPAEEVLKALGLTADQAARPLQELQRRGLLIESDGELHSPLLTKLHLTREHANDRQKRRRESLSATGVISRHNRRDIRRCHADVTPGPSPPSLFPPTPPLISSPTPEDSVCCANGAAALPTDSPARRRANGEKKPERPPVPGFAEAQRFWLESWAAAHHGAEYAPGKGGWPREGKDLAEILEYLHARDDVAKALNDWRLLVARFLREPNTGFYQGHRLPRLRENLAHFKSEVNREMIGAPSNVSRKPAAIDRGEFASDLPVRSRKLGNGQPAGAGTDAA